LFAFATPPGLSVPFVNPSSQTNWQAWVPAALASDGTSITIADNESRLEAVVVTEPFYDPQGELLRS